MTTREAIKRTKAFKDEFGLGLSDKTNLHTKDDCIARLRQHQSWLEDHCDYAMRQIDRFIDEIGAELEVSCPQK
jgi:hypothetical protein